MFLACVAGAGHCADDAAQSPPLVGAWQEGLTGGARLLPPEAPESQILLGDVLLFREDGTFRLYPRCGRQREALNRAGRDFMEGQWEIREGDALRISVETPDNAFGRIVAFRIDNGELRFTSEPSAPIHGRYDGPLPPRCPADAPSPNPTQPVKPVPAGLGVANGCRTLKLEHYALPKYPAGARRAGQEGWVVVRFDVAGNGTPLGPQVYDASPAKLFDADALNAMKAFRYAASAKGRKDCLQLFQFRLAAETE